MIIQLFAISTALLLCSAFSIGHPQQGTVLGQTPPSVNPSPTPTGVARVSVPPEKAKPLRVPRLNKPPVIDGKLNDEVWKQATVLKDFYQTNPGDNVAPSQPTEVFFGYDSKFFYIGVHAFDDPTKVRASVAQRDDVFGDDNIRIFFDTFNDQRKAYVLGWNPLGVQQDGIHTEDGGTDFSVDIVMESKGELTADGWTLRWRFHSSRCAMKPAKASFGASMFGETSIVSMKR